jgi:hypothetical protein
MTKSEILFRAVFHGDEVIVTHATDAEVELFAGKVGPPRDMLELWSFIAIRCGSAFDIHALGWRILLANTWITSPLRAIDLTARAIRTRSGHAYLLGRRDTVELDPELRAHLAYALRTWGFDDVSPP